MGRSCPGAGARARARHVYTVAAETTGEGLRYITVPVARTSVGHPRNRGLPRVRGRARELAGAAACTSDAGRRPGARIGRAARLGQLPRGLARGARSRPDRRQPASSPPSPGMRLLSVERSAVGSGWRERCSRPCRRQDALGARYTLAYELDVVASPGPLGDIGDPDGPGCLTPTRERGGRRRLAAAPPQRWRARASPSDLPRRRAAVKTPEPLRRANADIRTGGKLA